MANGWFLFCVVVSGIVKRLTQCLNLGQDHISKICPLDKKPSMDKFAICTFQTGQNNTFPPHHKSNPRVALVARNLGRRSRQEVANSGIIFLEMYPLLWSSLQYQCKARRVDLMKPGCHALALSRGHALAQFNFRIKMLNKQKRPCRSVNEFTFIHLRKNSPSHRMIDFNIPVK
ncbi:MAG: hypothetical protein COA78_16925 [Blastopirellula sp.]|nr:MAG: hypothetical protein COA78_16925 [Blastopirellula sp.]